MLYIYRVYLYSPILDNLYFAVTSGTFPERFTFSPLADAFIQSDLQERALQKVNRSMIINDEVAPKTMWVAKT